MFVFEGNGKKRLRGEREGGTKDRGIDRGKRENSPLSYHHRRVVELFFIFIERYAFFVSIFISSVDRREKSLNRRKRRGERRREHLDDGLSVVRHRPSRKF
jgi:hypothetical protein